MTKYKEMIYNTDIDFDRIILFLMEDERMKEYSKPTILINEELSEGVYAASGCYTVTTRVHQELRIGGPHQRQTDIDHIL